MKPQFSEAIKFKDGLFYNLPYHQARIDKTLARFGGEHIDIVQILSASNISRPNQQGVFKCRLVYGQMVESIEFIPYTLRNIKTVGLVRCDDIYYEYKSTNRHQLARLLAQSACDDILIVKQNCITDAFASNLVFESGEGLFTPDTCLLSGTKRQSLLDTEVITARRITLDDVRSYKRIYFINAMVDLDDNITIDIDALNEKLQPIK